MTAPTPEFLQVPRTGERDPIFGRSRFFFYQGERDGLWKLKRFRRPGATRGVTMIPVAEVRAALAARLVETPNAVYVS